MKLLFIVFFTAFCFISNISAQESLSDRRHLKDSTFYKSHHDPFSFQEIKRVMILKSAAGYSFKLDSIVDPDTSQSDRGKTEFYYDEYYNYTNEIEFEWDDLLGNWKKERMWEYAYDKNGNLISYIESYNWDEVNQKWILIGDNSKDEYTYNENGFRLSETGYDWNDETNQWVYRWKEEYFRNADGLLISGLYYRWNNTLSQLNLEYKDTLIYDDNNNLVRREDQERTNNQWINSSKEEHAFDAYGNIITSIYTSWDEQNNQWRNTSKTEYKYNNGFVISNAWYNWDEINNLWQVMDLEKYTYDPNNNVIEYIDSSESGFVRKTLNTYDENSNLVKTIRLYRDDYTNGWLNSNRADYTYNKTINAENVLIPSDPGYWDDELEELFVNNIPVESNYFEWWNEQWEHTWGQIYYYSGYNQNLVTLEFNLKTNSQSKSSNENISVTLAYHNNNSTFNHLDFKTATTDEFGKAEFAIPENSNFSLFVIDDFIDPYIFTDLHVMVSEKYDLNLTQLSDDVYLESPGIISQLYSNGAISVQAYCGKFENQPVDYNLFDGQELMFNNYQSNTYDYFLIVDKIPEKKEVLPAVVARPKKKSDLGRQLCDAMVQIGSIVSAYYGVGFSSVFFPFCYPMKSGTYYVDGRTLTSNPELIMMAMFGVEPTIGDILIADGIISVKKATQGTESSTAIGQKITDTNGNITGSVYVNGEFLEDRYEIPEVYYSGYNSTPNTIIITNNLEGNLTIYHTNYDSLDVIRIKQRDTIIIEMVESKIVVGTDSTLKQITVEDSINYPIARAEIQYDTMASTDLQYFDGTNSEDPFGKGLKYEWFENDNILSSESVFNRSFLSGQHLVGLKITDQRNYSTYDFANFYVINTTAINMRPFKDKPISEIEIYPNPFFDKTLITFSNTEYNKYQLLVIDFKGKIVKVINNITEDKIEISRDGLTSGLYLIELRGPIIYRGKIVIE